MWYVKCGRALQELGARDDYEKPVTPCSSAMSLSTLKMEIRHILARAKYFPRVVIVMFTNLSKYGKTRNKTENIFVFSHLDSSTKSAFRARFKNVGHCSGG